MKFNNTPLACAIGLITSAFTIGASAQLEEVVVTAQKRAQSIQDVPISITAFSGDYLEETGVQTIEDVARMTPNFTISNGAQTTNNRISIRGIGSVGNNGIEPSVGVFIDGVYYPRPGSVTGLLMDIESFEVLRGPQGTLFGRNTPMGALNITTRNPGQETEGLIEAGFGDYDAYEVGAMYNLPISDTIAARVAIKYADRDGYGENIYDGKDFGARDDLVARGKINFDFSEQLSLLVTADYAEINSEGGGAELVNSTRNPRFEATTTALYGDSPVTEDSYDWKINQEHDDKVNDEQQGLSLDINYDFDNGLALRSITAYRSWEANISESTLRLPTNMVPRFTNYQTDTFSQEFQLMSPGGETIDWLAGLFYYQENYDINQAFSAGNSYCIPTILALLSPASGAACLTFPQDRFVESDFNQELESVAAFGQATWNISESWNATLGVRWTEDQKDADFDQRVINPFATVIRSPETVLGMERDDSKTTGFANINWFVGDDTMLFVTASTGYKSGGFNSEGAAQPLGQDRRIFEPEDTTNYELGVKSTLLDGTMTANATVFRTDIEDFQDRAFDGLSFIVLNAGEIRQQGVEADLNWAPIDPLRIVAGISYLDSEYLDFEGAPPLPGGQPQDLKGERRNYSPEWQTSLAADWTQQFGDGLEWFVGASWSWIDEQNVGSLSNNNPQSIQESYSLLNGRLGIRSASGDWDATLFGNNLTEEGYCLSMFDQPFGAQLGAQDATNNTMVQRCNLGAPRTWNVRLTYRF